MTDDGINLGPCFWLFEWGGQHPGELADRLRSRGRSVEVLDASSITDSLSLEELPYDSDRVEAVCYLVIRLQKHEVSVVLENPLENGLVPQVRDRLENVMFVTPDNAFLEWDESLVVQSDMSVDQWGAQVIEKAEKRGHLDDGLSDSRSDEEVTDRLKNLGYI